MRFSRFVFLLSALAIASSVAPATAADYHCIEVARGAGGPRFICKLTQVANKHILKVFDRSDLRGLRGSLDRLGELMDLPEGTPMARCSGGRGVADARVDPALLAGIDTARGTGGQLGLGRGDAVSLGNGMFELRGAVAREIDAGCSGAGGGGGAAGGDGAGESANNGAGGGLGDILSGNRQLSTAQQERLVERARDALAGLAQCRDTGNSGLVSSPGAAAGASGGGAAGAGAAAGAGGAAELANTLLGAVAEPLGAEVVENLFEQHFLGADYAKDGTLIGLDVVRYPSKTDPQHSYLDIYGPANINNVPDGTKVAVNTNAVEGSTIEASKSPGGRMSMIQTWPNGDQVVVSSGGGSSTVTKIIGHDPDMPLGDADMKDVARVTTVYDRNFEEKDKKVVRTITTYRDGSQDIQEYDENGNPKGAPQHVEAGQATTPLPDNPDMGTCEGRARWVSLMTAFCESQNWQPPTCQAILLLVNGCADPQFTDPTPDGDGLICRNNRSPEELAAVACQRRKMIELVFPDSPRSSCKLPKLDKSLLIRDPGTIDPVPVDTRLQPGLGGGLPARAGKITPPIAPKDLGRPGLPGRCVTGQPDCPR